MRDNTHTVSCYKPKTDHDFIINHQDNGYLWFHIYSKLRINSNIGSNHQSVNLYCNNSWLPWQEDFSNPTLSIHYLDELKSRVNILLIYVRDAVLFI
jgi:hypothetical protein